MQRVLMCFHRFKNIYHFVFWPHRLKRGKNAQRFNPKGIKLRGGKAPFSKGKSMWKKSKGISVGENLKILKAFQQM